LHSLCTFGTYQHCLIFDVRRLPDRARSTCQFEDCRYGYGDYTYIVVGNVHLLDHFCGFATLRLWVGGCFDLTSFAGVLTSNQPRKLVKARVESFFVAARNCHVKGGPSPQMTGSGVSPVYTSFTAETTTPFNEHRHHGHSVQRLHSPSANHITSSH
jgi:hypothetical protein